MTLLNEQIPISSKKYSEALMAVIKDGCLSYEDAENSLNTVSDILNMSEDLVFTLNNPAIPVDTKISVAEEVFQKDVNSIILNFIKILIEKNRLAEFSKIKADFDNKLDIVNNVQTVEITSSISLNGEYKDKIVRKLSDRFKKNIRPVWSVDEKIIAGLIFKIDDNVLDTSLKTKLDKLSKNLM